jgi:hypothetical protein
MELAFLSSSKSEHKIVDDLAYFKAAMIIAETVALSPKDIYWIYAKYDYENIYPSIQQKIKALEVIYFNNPTALESLSEAKNDLKILTKLRNKTPAQIAHLNNINKSTVIFYEQTIKTLFNDDVLKEITDLHPFIEQVFVRPIDLTDDVNSKSHKDFVNHQVHEIVLKQFKRKNPPPRLFVLPFRYLQYKKATEEPQTKDINNKATEWLEAGFNVSGMDKLTLNELLFIREQTSAERKRFNEAMDVWIRKSMEDSIAFDDLVYYQTHVKEAVADFNSALEKHPILATLQQHHVTNNLQIGAMPVRKIWHYYHQLNLLDEEDLAKMKPFENEPAYAGRWPILCPSLEGNEPIDFEKTDNSFQSFSRKFINLDEA